jgi:hypothetical protein
MKRVSGVAGAAPIWHDFMEAVITQPDLLAEIGAPDGTSAAGWQFEAPPDVALVPGACPPRMACRAGGELFSAEWLAAAGDAGPLADTVSLVQAAPVAVGGRWVAYCRTEPAAPRALLKLPGPLGLPQAASGLSSALQPITNAAQDTESAAGPRPPRAVDVHKAVAWSLRTPTPVDVGRCIEITEIARQSGAGVLAGVDISSAADPNAGPYASAVSSVKGIGPTTSQALVVAVPPEPAGSPTPEAIAEATAAPVVVAAPGALGFSLAQAIINHNDCPGHYILGAVLGRNGAPMSGVRIGIVDEWGNRADAVSKSGANDAGRYDFPINNFPNRYTLTVLDGSGAAISAPVTVEHLQGYGGSATCHTVVWQAY